MTKILIHEATVKLAMKAFKECHYYMLDAGLPNQSLLNQAFTAHESLAEALKAQPAREPLTDDELADLWYKQSLDWMEFARAIEAAHNIKENT